MRTLKLTIAYDGTAYAGWQFQLGEPTVQETLENAIAKVTGQRLRVLASGRTDAGVHALGQVVGFRTDSALPPEVLLRALNANLPPTSPCWKRPKRRRDSIPRITPSRKRYRYLIHDGPVRDVFGRHFVWHYGYGRLDAEAMQRAATALVGTHDFRSFESSGPAAQAACGPFSSLRVERGRATALPSPFGRGTGGEGGAGGEGSTGEGYVERTVDVGTESGPTDAFHAPYEVMTGQGRAGEERFYRHRGRGRWIPVQHGSGDRRHAGASRPRRATGELASRGPAPKTVAPPAPRCRRKGCAW